MCRKLLALVLAGLLGACTQQKPATPAPPPPSSAEPVVEHVAIPRTKVLLQVPDGMRVAEELPGLGRSNSRSTVLVSTLPRTDKTADQVLDGLAEGFTSPKAVAQGIGLEPVRRLTVAGFPAISTSGTQKTAQGTFAKAMVAMVTDESTVLLTGTLEEGDPLSAKDLLAVLTAAKWSATAAPGDLGYDLTPAPGYQRDQAYSQGILLSLGGATGPDVPKLVLAPSLGQGSVPENERRDFATGRFGQLPPKPTAETTTQVEIAGLRGFELTGPGADGKTVYAVMLFNANGYVLISGDFKPAKHPDQLPAFRAMARSLAVG